MLCQIAGIFIMFGLDLEARLKFFDISNLHKYHGIVSDIMYRTLCVSETAYEA